MSEAIEIKLNAREAVIQRVLAMTENEAQALLEYIEHIEELEDAEDAEDAAYVAQHKEEDEGLIK